jgi:hypothetical protein
MLKAMGVFLMSLSALSMFSQSKSEYQAATITTVQPHQRAAGSDTSVASFDVSLRIGDTVYVVLYTPTLGLETVRYAVGHEVLVLVREQTITFNDITGASSQLPILSRTTIGKQSSPTNESPKQQAPMKKHRTCRSRRCERSTVRGFKEGSEEARQVTTVRGSTLITVHCQFTDNRGGVLLEQGRVRFFGGNLKGNL